MGEKYIFTVLFFYPRYLKWDLKEMISRHGFFAALIIINQSKVPTTKKKYQKCPFLNSHELFFFFSFSEQDIEPNLTPMTANLLFINTHFPNSNFRRNTNKLASSSPSPPSFISQASLPGTETAKHDNRQQHLYLGAGMFSGCPLIGLVRRQGDHLTRIQAPVVRS